MISFLTLAVSLLPTAWAIFPDEAFKIDYHHALLGLPQEHTTFFHQPQSSSKASLIYTLSDRFIVGAVNPKDGTLVWRQALESNSTTSVLVPGDGHESIVSGVDGQVSSWNALDGRMYWSRDYDLPGKLVDLNTVDVTSEGDSDRKDIVALFQASTPVVQKLDGRSGVSLWQYIDSSSDIPVRLSASPKHLYYISASSSLKKLKVTVLNPSNGQKIEQLSLSSDDLSSIGDLMVVPRSQSPVIAWPDVLRKSVKINVLGSKAVSAFTTSSGASEHIEMVSLHAPSFVTAKPHFLLQSQSAESHWGEVFHVTGTEAKPTVEKAYDVARLAGKGTFATSVTGDKVYFTRIARGAFLALDSDENNIVEHYALQAFGETNALDSPFPVLAIGEVGGKSGTSKHAIRIATLLSSGDWSLILNGEGSWVRHEGLAYATSAVFADLPHKQGLAQELEVEGHSTVINAYIHRVIRHIHDLQKLPELVQKLPETIMDSVLGKTVSTKDDTFGFHKHIVIATNAGRLFALDTSNQGKVVWSTELPEYQAGQTLQLSATSNGIVRVKTDSTHSVFDAVTGKFLRKGTDSGSSKSVSSTGTGVKFITSPTSVAGYLGDVHSSDSALWTFHPQPNEVIVNVTMRPLVDPVASIGDVLGNRKVLYKYLNPNLVLITAISNTSRSVTFYLLDGVSGNTLHTTTHTQVDITQPIPAILSENYFIYSLTLSNSTLLHSRGYILGISKFYESSLADDRGPLGAKESFSTLKDNSSFALSPDILSQTYHIPEPISNLALSLTGQGITTRLILASLSFSGALLSIPLHAVDPRRPVGRAPTKDEQAEGLTTYAPNLEFSPQLVISHRRDVLGLDKIIAAPSGLESTSLVVGYGIDVFGTRVAPSGEFDALGDGFAKGNMVTTVVSLFALVLVVAPIVARRTNDAKWSVPQ